MLYKKKLIRYFLSLSAGSLAVCTILFTVLIFNLQEANNLQDSQTQMYTASDVFRIAGQYIFSNVEMLEQSDSLQQWANAVDSSSYYFYPIQLQKEIQLANTSLDNFIFSMSFTTTNENDFFISAASTVSKADFFNSTHTNLSRSDWDDALVYFENGGDTYIVANYQDGEISELFLILYHFGGINDTVCLLTIQPQNLINSQSDLLYYIYPLQDGQSILLSSLGTVSEDTIATDLSAIDEALLTHTSQDSFVVECESYHLLYISSELFPFAFVFVQETSLVTPSNILLISFFPLAVFLFFMLPFSLFLSKGLYQPVSNILSNLLPSNAESVPCTRIGNSIDEFKIIQENTTSTALLNQALIELEREKGDIKKDSYYRALLFGIPDSDCPLLASEMELSYYVILLEHRLKDSFHHSQEIELLFQKNLVKNHMAACSAACEVFYYHDIENLLDAIVCSPDGIETVCTQINELSKDSSLKLDLFITKSVLVHSVMNIHHAYEEARELMEYRYILPKNKILTTLDIAQKSHYYYYFPLTVENQLITSIASGNKNSLVIYDRIIRQNQFGKAFSSETRKNFVFVLVHSVQRVFQELKQSPEELLHHPFDGQSLLDAWSQASIWSQIRLLISEILDALTQTKSTEHDLHFIMKDFIALHYAEDIMLNDLADYCKLTPSYCSALFKQHFDGVTFKVYLNQYRIKIACNLLLTNPNIKISDLSPLVGFNSSNSFIRAFNKEIGVSPKAYSETHTRQPFAK